MRALEFFIQVYLGIFWVAIMFIYMIFGLPFLLFSGGKASLSPIPQPVPYSNTPENLPNNSYS